MSAQTWTMRETLIVVFLGAVFGVLYLGLAGPKLHIWAFIRTMGEQITRLNSAGTSRRFRLAS
jgi:hypothetical protein